MERASKRDWDLFRNLNYLPSPVALLGLVAKLPEAPGAPSNYKDSSALGGTGPGLVPSAQP